MEKQNYKGFTIDIQIDKTPQSPREWSNLGYFITVDRNYQSPDNKLHYIDIVKDTGNRATSQTEHIKLIKQDIEATGDEKVLAVYPITKYEHSGVVYSLGTAHGFDNSNNGFYIITDKSQKETGTLKKDWEKVIKDELETYNAYANGEVYGFTATDPETGEEIGSCWGYYDSDHETNGLLEMAKGEIDHYIKHTMASARLKHEQNTLTDKTLGQLLGHANETIRRNATSILKQLQKKS